jgi:hypothetical protein
MIVCEALSEIKIKTPDGIRIISTGNKFETASINAANYLVKNNKIKILSTNTNDLTLEQSPQCPHCLQALEKQGIPAADIDVVKSATSTCGDSSAFNDQGPTSNSNSWNSEINDLISWFKTAPRLKTPFSLAGHLKVINPEKYFAALETEIAAGPKSPRAKYGTLQSDLLKLRNLFKEINEDN